MYGLVSIFIVVFLAGIIFEKEAQVTTLSAVQKVSNVSSDDKIIGYSDQCMTAGQSTSPGTYQQITNQQLAAWGGIYYSGNASWQSSWSCEIQEGPTAGTRFIVASFPGMVPGQYGNLSSDTLNDSTWFYVSEAGSIGGGRYNVASAQNITTGSMQVFSPALAVSGAMAPGSLLRIGQIGY